jgi:translation elongation factor EF-Ts
MFDIDTIKEVRDRTGHGLAACKDALQQVGGDADAAVKHLVGHAVPKPR